MEQAAAHLSAQKVDYSFIAAGYPYDPKAKVQVCNISTLCRRLDKIKAPDMVLWDEAHHQAAGQWAKTQERYAGAYHVGLSATPQRLDGAGLNDYYEEMVTGPKVAWLIENGFLSNYSLYRPPCGLDLSKVKKVMGDYNKKQLEEEIERSQIVGEVTAQYKKYMDGGRAVVFASSVGKSKEVAERFNDAGIPSAHIDGTTPKEVRQKLISLFKENKLKVLSNVDLVGEGFDLPGLDGSILLRPTQSAALYLQQVGRALRVSEGKEKAIIIDQVGNSYRHGLPCEDREWTLLGRTKNKREQFAVKTCPSCFATFKPGRKACPECEYVFPAAEVQREIREIEGDLQEVDLKAEKEKQKAERREEQSMAETLDDLIAIGKTRGYKSPIGWAKHVYNGRKRR